MARPIEPIAVRRLKDGGPIEVQSKGGQWIPWTLLSTASQNNATSYFAARLAGLPRQWFPAETFMWVNGELPQDRVPEPDGEQEQQQEQQLQQGQERESVQPDQSDQEQSDQEADSEQPQPEPESQEGQPPMTIEDMVRRIASDLDAVSGADLLGRMRDEIDQRLAEFQPETFSGPIARIEIKSPELREFDGLFHHRFPLLAHAVATGDHVYLPGPPGTGKSHAAEQVARMLGWQFASLSLGPTTPESRFWGGMDANGKFFEPPFVRLARFAQENPESGAVYCLDEMDNGHPGILATLNSAMANGWFTAPCGDVVTMGKNFVIVAAANTFGTGPTAEFAGRNKIDPATLDRFSTIPWDTDEAVEATLVRQYLGDGLADQWLDVWRTARANVASYGLKMFVTMRGAVAGARLIASGVDLPTALNMKLGWKVPADQWAKINPL